MLEIYRGDISFPINYLNLAILEEIGNHFGFRRKIENTTALDFLKYLKDNNKSVSKEIEIDDNGIISIGDQEVYDGKFEELEDFFELYGIPFDRETSSTDNKAPYRRYYRPQEGNTKAIDEIIELNIDGNSYIEVDKISSLLNNVKDFENLSKGLKNLIKTTEPTCKPLEEYTKDRLVDFDKSQLRIMVNKNVEVYEKNNFDSSECAGFNFVDTWIHDPFSEDTGRFEVDPVLYYGEHNILKFIKSWNDIFNKV